MGNPHQFFELLRSLKWLCWISTPLYCVLIGFYPYDVLVLGALPTSGLWGVLEFGALLLLEWWGYWYMLKQEKVLGEVMSQRYRACQRQHGCQETTE